jgi:hypothetical protein
MELLIQCKLDPQVALIDEGNKITVLGLAELHTCPTRNGLGQDALRIIARIAENDGYQWVIGFATEEVEMFYKTCGWSLAVNTIVGKIDGLTKRAVYWSSDPDDMVSGHIVEPLEKDW